MVKNQGLYTPEFKQQIIDLCNAGGTSYPQLGREYGVNRSTLSNWIKQFSPIKVSKEETVTLKEYKALQREIQRLKIENEILKKSDRHIHKRTIAEIMIPIQNHLNHYTVSQLCSTLKFSRSTYYKALARVPLSRQEEYEEFGGKVKQAYDESQQRYGTVKICRILNNNGTLCSVKRAQRYMEQQGLRSVVVKKYNHHTNRGAIPDDKANTLKRDLTVRTINQRWCTDITYIHVLKEGWTYLASAMDLCSRKIIGYAHGTSMTTELAAEAVKNACLNVKNAQGILLHSDLGSQYASQASEVYLSSRGIFHSFSHKGDPCDSACIKSLHPVLKKEEIYLHTYQDFREARRVTFEHIEGWYNRKRIHSVIGCVIPQ